MAVMTYSSLLDDMRAYMERGDATDATVYEQLPKLVDLAERRIARALKVQGFIAPLNSTFNLSSVVEKPSRWRQTVSVNFGQSTDLYRTATRSSAGTTRTLFLDRPTALTTGDQVKISGVGDSGYDGTFTLTDAGFMSISYASTALTETITDAAGYVADVNSFNKRTTLYPRSYEYCREYWPNESSFGVPQFYADYDINHWLVVPTPCQRFPFETLVYQIPDQLDDTNQTNYLTEFCPGLLLYASLLEAQPFLKNDERIPIWQAGYKDLLDTLNVEELGKIVDRSVRRAGA